MKKLTLIFSLLMGILFALSLSAAAQFGTNGRAQVCAYEHNNFGGWQRCFNPGDEISDLGSEGGKISSIRLYGDARVIVYADKGFKGSSMDVASNLNDLAQAKMTGGIINISWNDQIESLRVIGRPVASRPPAPPPVASRPPAPPVWRDDDRDYRNDRRPNGREDAVCIYDQPNFKGRYQCYDSGDEVANLSRNGNWSNRISSIRVYGPTRVTLYREVDFRGERITIDRDVYDLRQVRQNGRSWDNQISSLDINGGRGRAYGRDNRR